MSENPSQALHKVSEIYDRIAFAAVGRYNEFENLRIAGVRLADMRGYAYDRRDVTGRGLANAYAQTLGTIFSSGGEKPYEVEIFVAEVGDAAAEDQIYRLTYDGQVADEHGYAVMGGAADVVAAHLKEQLHRGRLARRRAAARRGRPGPLRPRAAGRPGGPGRPPRGRRAGPHPDPAAQVPPAPAGAAPRAARRPRSRDSGAPSDEDRRPDAAPAPAATDDPADPTDQVSGGVPPLEDPTTGEPPVAPPPADPSDPPDGRRPAAGPSSRPSRRPRAEPSSA